MRELTHCHVAPVEKHSTYPRLPKEYRRSTSLSDFTDSDASGSDDYCDDKDYACGGSESSGGDE